jgi:hypothetical protein
MYDELDLLIKSTLVDGVPRLDLPGPHRDAIMMLGESGVGKTSIVSQVCDKYGLGLWTIHWAQIAPVDARGVPVPDRENKLTEFYPPKMLPRKGPGVIFLDEYNMSVPTMMGIGQQVIHEKRFGDYVAPKDVLVWSAGNRKIDRAAVNEMPAPTNNRFGHYTIVHDLAAWRLWAFNNQISPDIIGFLDWRPELLHKFDPNSEDPAWPSPRTWEMADRRYKVRMSIEPVVGEAVGLEFDAYRSMLNQLPNIVAIAEGRGERIKWVEEPSVQYATVAGLTSHGLKYWTTYKNCFTWLARVCAESPEYVQCFVSDIVRILGRGDKRRAATYLQNLHSLPEAKRFIDQFVNSIQAGRS